MHGLGGQLWMFAIGVGHYVFETFDINKITFLASSCGCYAAVPLACGLDPYEWCKRDWGKCMRHFTSRGLLGCFFDSKEFYFELWNDYLPDEAHILCSGRLFISVTIFPSLQNRVISNFPTRVDLINAIVASMCLPFVFIRDFPVACSPDIGLCIDGGFSNDSPCLDSYTITVSALHKEADIQPRLGRTQCEMITCSNSECDTSSVLGFDDDDEDDEDNELIGNGGICRTPSAGSDEWLQRQLTEEVSLSPEVKAVPDPNKAGRILVSQNAPSPAPPHENAGVTATPANTNTDTDTDTEPNSALSPQKVPAATKRYYESLGYDTYEQYRNRLKPSDIIKTPTYERVWEVGGMGIKSAAQCVDFTRHEWQTIMKKEQ